MAVPVYVPRVNNNDDEVRLVELRAAIGSRVGASQVIAAVETDKAVVEVEASVDGYVLSVHGDIDAKVKVGAVLIWLGASADEPAPVAAPDSAVGDRLHAPTGKALALLREYGLAPTDVKARGERLSADDVRAHVLAKGLVPADAATSGTGLVTLPEPAPETAGILRPLLGHERGILHTVTWQRDVAVPGYIELAYDHVAWEKLAAAFGREHNLLLNPLLPLLAWRLVELAALNPRCNATLVGEQRYEYRQVNLGFTVQVGEVLYLAVLNDAQVLGEVSFVKRLIDVQRRAASHSLQPQEMQGATIGLSSMSRWKVARHVPILAPRTALMVAHTVGADGQGVLGATYDHRVLHGGEVATLLRKLSAPKPRDRESQALPKESQP